MQNGGNNRINLKSSHPEKHKNKKNDTLPGCKLNLHAHTNKQRKANVILTFLNMGVLYNKFLCHGWITVSKKKKRKKHLKL